MDKFETEYEKSAREQREAIEAFQKVFLETKLGKAMIFVLDWLNRLLKKYVPDRFPAWVKWAFWGVAVLLAVLFVLFSGSNTSR